MNILPGEKKQVFHDASVSTRYVVENNAHLTLFDIRIDKMPVTSNVQIMLNGPGAMVDLYGLFFGIEKESYEISHIIEHRAPHTVSRIVTRGALDGHAKASYTGQIHIPKKIAGCIGQEEAHILLLSKNAHIDAVPHLEIGNNDVVCSHSLSIAHVDELKKFYLESRGIHENDVLHTILSGHFSFIFDKMEEQQRIPLENLILNKVGIYENA